LTLELHLRIAGILLLFLAAIHPLMPRELGWKEDLAKLTLVNRQVFLVHTAFIVLTLVLMGSLALVYAEELAAQGRLARAVLGGLAIFWGARLFTQQFVYDRTLWRGNARYTAIHVVFSLLWLSLRAVLGGGGWGQ
jgi:hypothetical protein